MGWGWNHGATAWDAGMAQLLFRKRFPVDVASDPCGSSCSPCVTVPGGAVQSLPATRGYLVATAVTATGWVSADTAGLRLARLGAIAAAVPHSWNQHKHCSQSEGCRALCPLLPP